jgi:hypothetical protein
VCARKTATTRGNSSEAGTEPKHQAFGRISGGVATEHIRKHRTEGAMKPRAEALPRPGAEVKPGKFGSPIPKTVANGFTIIAKVKPGCAPTIRAYANAIEKAVAENPEVLAPLRLHYLRWVLFDNDTRFMYIGIFDTDFDKYVDDAVMLFKQSGITTVFEQLEGFPKDWRENPAAFAKFAREHQAASFMEYAEYPDVTGVEIVKAVKVRNALSEMLDQMQ